MRRDWRRSWAGVSVLALLAPVFLDGCVSVGISRSRPPASKRPAGGLDVKIYETSADRRQGTPSTRKIISELVRIDVKPEQQIYRVTEATWSLDDLPPGR